VTRVTLGSPVRSAAGIPVVVDIYDAEMVRAATTVLHVGRPRELTLPPGPHATAVIRTPSGNTLAATLTASGKVIDLAPLSASPGMLRPALTTLAAGHRPWTPAGALWMRLWHRPAATGRWATARARLLTSVEATGLRARSTGGPSGAAMVQVGGDDTIGRLAAVPDGGHVDVLLRTTSGSGTARPLITVLGADPGTDALMAYLTAGRLPHAAVLAESLQVTADAGAGLALAYAGLLLPGIAPQKPGESCDWAVVRAARLCRDEPEDGRDTVRALTLHACRTGPPTWTVGLRLLAGLLRTIRDWPGGLGADLDQARYDLGPLLAAADLAAPTVTFPGTGPDGVGRPVRGVPPDAFPLLTPVPATVAVPLPEPAPPSGLAAHSGPAGPSEPPIHTPGDNRLRLIHDPVLDRYEVRLDAAAHPAAVLAIRFTDLHDTDHVLWLPITDRGRPRFAARAVLAGRAPGTRVVAEAAVPAADVTVWNAGTLRASTRAALDNGTRAAWTQVLRQAGPDVAHLIDGDLLHLTPDQVYPPTRPSRLPEPTQDLLADLADSLPHPVPDSGAVLGGLLQTRIHGGHLEIDGPEQLRGALIHVSLGPGRDRLIPLDAAGHGMSPVQPSHVTDLRVVAAFDPARSEDGYAEMIRRCVEVTRPEHLDDWRRIARDRPYGDPIRTAIVDGLRSLT
jgi:hypothetical protein